MSTLTKILVILLAFLSFALCGAVITYIGNADNYKDLYEEQKNTNAALASTNKNLTSQITENTEKWKQLEKSQLEKIQQFQALLDQKDTQLRQLDRTTKEYEARINSWVAVLTSFNTTISNLEQSLKVTQQQLDTTREKGIQNQKELNEITASLYEKIVQMQSLEAERKRFLEEKKALEDKMNQILGAGAVTAPASAQAAVPEVRTVTIAEPDTAISGLITEIGQSLVTISVGIDDGVREGMVFHVTRGQTFICDVLVTNVDTNKSAGNVELKLDEPRIGDLASTKL